MASTMGPGERHFRVGFFEPHSGWQTTGIYNPKVPTTSRPATRPLPLPLAPPSITYIYIS